MTIDIFKLKSKNRKGKNSSVHKFKKEETPDIMYFLCVTFLFKWHKFLILFDEKYKPLYTFRYSSFNSTCLNIERILNQEN